MNSGWSQLPTDAQADSNFENYMEKLAEPMPEPPKPDIPTQLVDFAGEAEKKQTYIPKDTKPFQERKAAGITKVSEPVNVYEPGFRSDMYSAIVKYFKEKRAEKERVQKLREKLGLRG